MSAWCWACVFVTNHSNHRKVSNRNAQFFDIVLCKHIVWLRSQKLQVTQNKVVRFILNKPPIQHIGQHELDMVNLLNTEHRVKQLMMTHMYNIYNGNAPSYLCQRFIRIHDHHQHHTRLSEYCFVTARVKSANQSNFSYWGVETWNVIPTVIKTATNVSLFKSAVKRHYVILAHESEESDYLIQIEEKKMIQQMSWTYIVT